MTPARARLMWRCRRGTKELDLLMQTWLLEGYDRSTVVEQRAFEALLDWSEDRLSRLLLGQEPMPDTGMEALAIKIRSLSFSQT